MPNSEKIQIVENIEEHFNNSTGIYFTKYTGLSVVQATKLRDKLRENNVTYKVTKNTLTKYVTTPIKVIPLWHNENIWKFLNNKIKLRQKFNFSEDDFLVGSIQKDTEGASISNKTYKPKLEKGPDLFVKAVTLLKKVIVSPYLLRFCSLIACLFLCSSASP